MRMVLYVIGGAAFGYGWYRVVGCSTGACPLTSNPWTSTGWGALMGFLMAGGGT